MTEVEPQDNVPAELSAEKILAQLELLARDENFSSSRRSIAFLKYVVEETLKGFDDQIKERTIGIEVFGRPSSYDTNQDHVVRTAATELRKRLAIYYGDEKHRSELRIGLVPGSYIPKFSYAHPEDAEDGMANHHGSISSDGSHEGAEHYPRASPDAEHNSHWAVQHRKKVLWVGAACATLLIAASLGTFWLSKQTPEHLFWKPVLDTPGPVLLAVGDVPNGPPKPTTADGTDNSTPAILQSDASRSVPFADAMTIAKVVGVLEANGKTVLIRRENSRSFSDLREGPVVLIGAFNNEWSLRLTHRLRFTMALDADKHLIYIKDSKNPASRAWSWGTNQPRENIGGAGGPVLYDYALISRIRNSETGHVVVVIGGLYTYGTQSAGEFLTDPLLMQSISKVTKLGNADQNLQIVLGTTVTDGTPGPPKVLAIVQE